MPRLVYGPSQDHLVSSDVEITIAGIHSLGRVATVVVDVPPYGAESAKLEEVYAVFSDTPPELGETPETYLARPESRFAVVAAGPDGEQPQSLTILVPDLKGGRRYCQTILKFAE